MRPNVNLAISSKPCKTLMPIVKLEAKRYLRFDSNQSITLLQRKFTRIEELNFHEMLLHDIYVWIKPIKLLFHKFSFPRITSASPR